MRRFASLLVVVLACLVAQAARADSITDAEELFRRAKALMAVDKHADACPLLKESYRLDPAQGTLLNLALCNERIGAIGTAWGQFRVVEQQARRATPPREDREKLAREHADKLEPRLSRIRLLVPPAARAAGLVVKVDGEEKREPLWATGIVVDPGTRAIEASAPGKKTAKVSVKIDDEGVVQDVTLTPLEDAPADAAPAAFAKGPDLAELEVYAASRARRTTGYVVGGIGLAVLAAGGAFGVAAIVNNDEAKKCGSPCYRDQAAGQASDQATDRALVFANLANVTVPIGVLGTAVGAYLVLTAGPTTRVAVTPRASARANGVDVSVQW